MDRFADKIEIENLYSRFQHQIDESQRKANNLEGIRDEILRETKHLNNMLMDKASIFDIRDVKS